MGELFKNIRFFVLSFSVLLSIAMFVIVKTTVPSGSIQIIKLTQIYALTAVTFLYLSLMATPVTRYFKFLPFRGEYIKARRALGVSVFYFACLHAYLAFFKQLGGFAGLGFLSPKYLLAVILSFTALVILAFMASTSFDFMVEKLSFKKWKFLHRFVYLAGVLILIHAMMLGSHFADLSKSIPKIFFGALAILLILEARRFDEWLSKKYELLPSFGVGGTLVFAGIVYFLFSYVFISGNEVSSLGIHSQHILDAKKDVASGVKLSVAISPLTNIYPGKNTFLQFKVFNATTGDVLKDFSINQEKIMHLIVVSDDLKYFDHIHPDLKDGIFSINYKFPTSGNYHLYSDFVPTGMSEQYYPFSVSVGTPGTATPQITPDFVTETVVDVIKAQIILPKNVNAKDLNSGSDVISFKLVNAKTNEEVKNIDPYLGAFGHLIMINTVNYQYIHVHPKQGYTPIEGETSGPNVEFSPLGIYGNINPGTYKLFAQFKIDGRMYIFPFFAKVN